MHSELIVFLLASLFHLTLFAFFFFLDTIANKLHLQKINDFVLSPGPQPYKVISMFLFMWNITRLNLFLVLSDYKNMSIIVYMTQKIK